MAERPVGHFTLLPCAAEAEVDRLRAGHRSWADRITHTHQAATPTMNNATPNASPLNQAANNGGVVRVVPTTTTAVSMLSRPKRRNSTSHTATVAARYTTA